MGIVFWLIRRGKTGSTSPALDLVAGCNWKCLLTTCPKAAFGSSTVRQWAGIRHGRWKTGDGSSLRTCGWKRTQKDFKNESSRIRKEALRELQNRQAQRRHSCHLHECAAQTTARLNQYGTHYRC